MQPHQLILLAGLATTAMPSLVQAQTLSPRDAVADIGKAIADTYFDPVRGAQIATDLNSAAARGEFDALTDARDLAQALTGRLNPLDRHFNVRWSAPAAATPAAATPVASTSDAPPQVGRLPFREVARKANYGFRGVELLPGNIGLITLSRFFPIDFDDPQTPTRLTADAALRMVADADAIIIDLRDNGGGDPSMVGYLASAFVPAEVDAYNTFQSRNGFSSERPGQPHANPRTQTPLFILVSGRSASATESFSYTLQAAGRATIVGQTTAGAANPGRPVEFTNGLSIFIPIESPRNPITGDNWEGVGVKPDIEAPDATSMSEAYRQALIAAIKAQGENPIGAEALWTLETLSAAPVNVVLDGYVGQYGGVKVDVASDTLTYQDRRRPLRTMKALSPDLFSDVEDPTRRLRFIRDDTDHVIALEFLSPDGYVTRRRRDAE